MTTPQSIQPISAAALHAALTLRDLTDPSQGAHAMQLLIEEIVESLAQAWNCRVLIHRAPAITTVSDNYDRLHYPSEGVARDVLLG